MTKCKHKYEIEYTDLFGDEIYKCKLCGESKMAQEYKKRLRYNES